ncbi:MAG: hypothetical protein ACKPBU_13185, partial [Alphaproteobacteria bacterium]
DDLGLERRRPYFFEPRGTRSLPEQSPDEPLLGVGTSARSQIGDTVFRNLDRSTGYVERIERGESPVETSFRLREGDRQALFVAATLGNGGSLRRDDWRRRFGRPIDDEHGGRMAALRDGALLVDDGESIRLSTDGLLVYDRVVLGFYPEFRQAEVRDLPPPRNAAGDRGTR